MPTRVIKIGNVSIGGENPVAIQSMTNTSTSDRDATASQLQALERAGCDIARIAFETKEQCEAIPFFRSVTRMPLVADIQYDYRIAIAAIEQGIDKVRINPGNIGEERRVRMLLDCAAAHRVPIRIGVNSGSLQKDLKESDLPSEEKLTQSALRNVRLCEKYGFERLVVSVKSSSAAVTVLANRKLSEAVDYPLHLGVTEAGSYDAALVKSAAALGSLLLDGIGDTIRVSVTGDVCSEISAAKQILRAVGRDRGFCEIVSCPTCSRTKVDLIALERRVRERYGSIRTPLKLAVMGCAVNGPGEASDADFGIAGGDGKGVVFAKGKIIASASESELFDVFCAAVDRYLEETNE